MENGTWELVDLPEGQKAIKCKWVYTIKADGCYKARLVAKGFSQQYGIDCEETFSPVARWESICFLLAHAALENWEIESLDVKTAFLYGKLDEEIYMEQPEGFMKKKMGAKVCRLRKAIYGLKQASPTWYYKIDQSLTKLGFVCTKSDTGIYVYHQRQGEVIVILYVDNILNIGPELKELTCVKEMLSKEYQMQDFGTVS
ncbi:hypothetical protein PHLCEN_2v6371 [Hermanssonia centrifuga]|uniref:Reverse transcriptase Ty1/copia-type domain-containing protein n=1 Tax=Hermanssonia centrifuga TaxID=98765 RepID=A0A2R6NZL0_9APHY|nr:hypothetical protein PHLCEN_2v6371 [Hermanssonia centrifuga]